MHLIVFFLTSALDVYSRAYNT